MDGPTGARRRARCSPVSIPSPCRDQVVEDHMAALLAPEREPAAVERLEHVPVAYRRSPRSRCPRRAIAIRKSQVASSPSPRRVVAEAAGACRSTRAHGDNLIAVDELARLRRRQRRGRRPRRRPAPDRRRSRAPLPEGPRGACDPQRALMLRPSGSTFSGSTDAPSVSNTRGADHVRGPVRAVEHQRHAVEAPTVPIVEISHSTYAVDIATEHVPTRPEPAGGPRVPSRIAPRSAPARRRRACGRPRRTA